MELVNGAKRSESRKKKTVRCTVFPVWPLAASPTVGARVRADDKSHLLFVVLAIYIAWLLIKMELVNGAKAE